MELATGFPRITDFSTEALAPVIAEATQNQTPEQWASKYLASIAILLKRSPRSYRAYGAFWWPLREELSKRDLFFFEEKSDPDLVGQVDYGDVALNVAAAHAYSEWSHQQLANQSNVHRHAISEGESIDYRLWDDELEALGQFR